MKCLLQNLKKCNETIWAVKIGCGKKNGPSGKEVLFLSGHGILYKYDAMSSFESAFFLTISRPKQLSLLLRRLPSSSLFTIGYQDFLVKCCANVCTFEDK